LERIEKFTEILHGPILEVKGQKVLEKEKSEKKRKNCHLKASLWIAYNKQECNELIETEVNIKKCLK
jgi:hypothetical protein